MSDAGRISRAASEIDAAIHRFEMLVDPGYGGPVSQLLERLRFQQERDAEVERLREALKGAARSLEAAAGAGRKESLIADLESLRPWAKARARLARAALGEKGG